MYPLPSVRVTFDLIYFMSIKSSPAWHGSSSARYHAMQYEIFHYVWIFLSIHNLSCVVEKVRDQNKRQTRRAADKAPGEVSPVWLCQASATSAYNYVDIYNYAYAYAYVVLQCLPAECVPPVLPLGSSTLPRNYQPSV